MVQPSTQGFHYKAVIIDVPLSLSEKRAIIFLNTSPLLVHHVKEKRESITDVILYGAPRRRIIQSWRRRIGGMSDHAAVGRSHPRTFA